jgi:hypothetical protein
MKVTNIEALLKSIPILAASNEFLGGIANAPNASTPPGGKLTPPLTKGNSVPSGLPYFSFGDPAASWRGI